MAEYPGQCICKSLKLEDFAAVHQSGYGTRLANLDIRLPVSFL